jgi:gluconate kinase
MRTAAVVLTGPPGAGKSAVLVALANLLEVDGVEFGALEAEQLGWGSPWLQDEPWLGQLKAVMEIQRRAGRRLFLIAATTETSRDLAAVIEAIAADERVAVLLSASADVVAARIEAREPDWWVGKLDLIDHARGLATSMQDLTGIDLRISTEDRRPGDVALEVRDTLRARGLTL